MISIWENFDGITGKSKFVNVCGRAQEEGCEKDGSMWDTSRASIKRAELLLNFHLGLLII